MSVQERLDELSPYVTAIRYGSIPIIETAFPKSWGVREHKQIKVEPLDGKSDLVTNCLVFSEAEGITIDDVLQYVEDTIKINQEREVIKALLKAKVEELKELFNNNSLSKLQDLYFGFTEPEQPDDLDLDLELTPNVLDGDTYEDAKKEPFVEAATGETTSRITASDNVVAFEGENIRVELPPRKPEAPKLEEFDTPTCQCGEGESCPECTDL